VFAWTAACAGEDSYADGVLPEDAVDDELSCWND